MISEPLHINEPLTEDFRDHLATIDEKGKRKWVFAYHPKGKFYRIRSILSIFYFLVFFGLPFVHVNGRPFIMLNIPKGRFILFSKVFWPQDFFIFGLGMVAFIFFIILFTAAFGRLFCGWACPQTNFMEMMFRKIEYWVIGDAPVQRQLKNSPWTSNKIFKLSLKHILFFFLSCIIANTFLAYIIGISELQKIIAEPVSEHVVGFASLIVFSAVFYAVYAFFREQACTVVCPYGRLQSVLLDKNSMIVAYDYKRGEPRGHEKNTAEIKGDCIDCYQCVKVCPTGIDIRNGVQMECVGCTACIDACDHIMLKTGKEKGLIRYASENSIANGVPLKYTARMKIYTALCGLVLLILSAVLFTRKDVDATIMRTPGIMYQEHGTDSISNLYNIKVVNKTVTDIPLTIRSEDNGRIQIIGRPFIEVAKEGQGAGAFFVILPNNVVRKRKTEIKLGLYEGEKKIAVLKTNFLSPVN
ncbi:MAG: cytochrome c oxidase accessory protein CcoG [Bacteroidota bacterium]